MRWRSRRSGGAKLARADTHAGGSRRVSVRVSPAAELSAWRAVVLICTRVKYVVRLSMRVNRLLYVDDYRAGGSRALVIDERQAPADQPYVHASR